MGHCFDECEREALIAQKDAAYKERNQLVRLLSKIFPASLERHPAEEEWEDDWRWIVFIALPSGQATWHIHDSELKEFSHLISQGRKWDGHTTEEKYERVAGAADGVVILDRKDYDELVADQRLLRHLRAKGVDNWEGYSCPKSDVEEEDDDD